MGRVSENWMEMQERHIETVSEKSLCIRHINDTAIKAYIRNNYESGFCDYCCKKVKVVSLDDLMIYIMNGVNKFYEDAANFMSYSSREGGYLGRIYTSQEIIEDHIGLITEPHELTTDIIDCIEDIAWASQSLHYGDTERDFFLYSWGDFKNTIKHKSRFLLLKSESLGHSWRDPIDPLMILKEIGRLVVDYRLIKTLKASKVLYRCRQVKEEERVSDIQEIVAPPAQYAIHPNRFSPAGISMFYAAFEKETAHKETIDYSDNMKPIVITGELINNRSIKVIDFTRIPEMPSIFKEIPEKKYYLLWFLHDLVKDIVKPIEKDGKEHIDYVPTQIVTEYIRYVFNKRRKNKIEGIIYPSSKDQKEAIVLFWDNEQSIKRLSLMGIERERYEIKDNNESLNE